MKVMKIVDDIFFKAKKEASSSSITPPRSTVPTNLISPFPLPYNEDNVYNYVKQKNCQELSDWIITYDHQGGYNKYKEKKGYRKKLNLSFLFAKNMTPEELHAICYINCHAHNNGIYSFCHSLGDHNLGVSQSFYLPEENIAFGALIQLLEPTLSKLDIVDSICKKFKISPEYEF